MNDQIPTGLPQEPNPLDPTPNIDVLDPSMPGDTGRSDPDAPPLLTPGFGDALPEPAY